MAADLRALFDSKYPAAGSIRYVDGASGNDSNAGTTSSPKKTIQAALAGATPGTRIYVRTATYSSVSLDNLSGNSNAWIIVAADVGHSPKINASSAPEAGFVFNGSNYCAVWGFEIYGGGSETHGENSVGGAHHNATWNCNVHDNGGQGIGANNCTNTDLGYNLVHGNSHYSQFHCSGMSIFQPIPGQGPSADGYHNHIVGNIVWDNYEDASVVPDPTDGNGLIFDLGQDNGYTGKSLVARNLIVANGGGGIHPFYTDNVHAYFNTVANNLRTGGSGLAGEGELHGVNNGGCIARFNLVKTTVGLWLGGTWTNDSNVILQGNTPSPSSNGNFDKTSIGAAYVENANNGIGGMISVTGWRPVTSGTPVRVDPGSAVRSLLASWPDALLNLPPSNGTWAVGALEAGTSTGTGTAPVAAFATSPSSPTAGQTATFTDQSTNTPTSRAWTFGDGASSTATNPTHTFVNAGSYTVTLTVTNAGGTDTVSHTVIVVSGGGIDPGPTNCVQLESASLGNANSNGTGPVVSTEFGGYISTGYLGVFGLAGDFAQVTYTPPAAGSYNMVTRYRQGGSDTPTPMKVSINGVDNVTYAFGRTATDWSVVTGWIDAPAAVVLLAAGTNTIRFHHDGPDGLYVDLDQVCFGPTSGPPGLVPVPDFGIVPGLPQPGQNVQFTDLTQNNPTSWSWNFGDGGTSTAQSPQHAYSAAGTYSVSVVATNTNGSGSTSKTIVVSAAPPAGGTGFSAIVVG
jgi:PKD repeat protein